MTPRAAAPRGDFPRQATSVARARHFVAAALDDAPDSLRRRAELLVSELATNAVKHAGSDFSVLVERRDGAVRIEVLDHGEGVPARRSPGVLETSGRGLMIVAALADEWGVAERRDGKVVWFTLSLGRG